MGTGSPWSATVNDDDVFATPRLTGDTLSFELPGGLGAFRGQLARTGGLIRGHWLQPPTAGNGTPYASPVTLTALGREQWRGEVVPLDDALTFYLRVQPRADGTMGAFLHNPERNLGRFIRVDRLERNGETVRLLAAPSGGAQQPALAQGVYRDSILTIAFPDNGGTYDYINMVKTPRVVR